MPKRISKISKRAPPKRSRAAPSLPYEGWLVEQLKDPAEAAAYLEAVLEDGSQAAIMLALRQVAQAQGGVAHVARKAKLTREATYKMLSKSGNPELRSLSAVLKATGLRIAVRPIAKQAGMPKKPLLETNTHLSDPSRYRKELLVNVSTSTSVETGTKPGSIARALSKRNLDKQPVRSRQG